MNQGVIFKYDIAFLTLVFPLPNFRILQVYQADFDLRLHFCIFSKWEVYKSSLQWGLTPGILNPFTQSLRHDPRREYINVTTCSFPGPMRQEHQTRNFDNSCDKWGPPCLPHTNIVFYFSIL